MIKIVIHFSIRLYWRKGHICEKQQATEHKVKESQIIRKKTERLRDLCEQTMQQLAISRGKSTLDNYRTALRSLLSYAGNDIDIEAVSSSLIEGYQHWLQQQGKTLNTVSCYMRSLRSLMGQISIKVPVDEIFKNVFTGNSRTDKRSLPREVIQRLRQLPLQENTPICFARDLFLFSIFTLGMPFVDIAFLRKNQIRDGYITYQRHKTGQRIRVKVERPAMQIINRYHQKGTNFVFPILQQGTMQEYQSMRRKYNRLLQQLEHKAELHHHLTSYVARHSWASLAYHQNIDLPVISKALGHTSSQTTLTYIREIDDHRVDDANHLLVNQIVKGI